MFLISKIVVPNQYSHGTAYDLNSSHPYLKFQVRLKDLFQSDLQILYSLQTDNGILQCVHSNWTGISKNKFVVLRQYTRYATPLLISFYQKWWHLYADM